MTRTTTQLLWIVRLAWTTLIILCLLLRHTVVPSSALLDEDKPLEEDQAFEDDDPGSNEVLLEEEYDPSSAQARLSGFSQLNSSRNFVLGRAVFVTRFILLYIMYAHNVFLGLLPCCEQLRITTGSPRDSSRPLPLLPSS